MSEIVADAKSATQTSPQFLLKDFLTAFRKTSYRLTKRFFDIIFGLIGCIFVLPIAACIKIAFLATGDRHSIFYSQKRIGLHGKTFKMYKFRSMVKDADAILEAKLASDPEFAKKYTHKMKLDHDPRITKVGHFLRKSSIDEVPQFINILKGDMSLIGPRPLVKGELKRHHGNSEIYNSIRPGITSWWGANGRSNITYKERLALEYFYVENCSFWLDVKCIVKTVFAVLSKKGAK